MVLPDIISQELIDYIKSIYRLRWTGIHGWNHWIRVYENGMFLTDKTGADSDVVALFAFTHDMTRQSDHGDFDHGPRAADVIQAKLQGHFFSLDPARLQMLVEAVAGHTRGLVQAGITVQTCWDADRLDLGRAGIHPSAERLCTAAAKDPRTIEWAYRRSLQNIAG